MIGPLDELNTEICVLESHLDGLLTCIRQNELKLHRFQALENHLLTLNALAELIEHLLDDTETVFELEHISLCLVDQKNELQRFLKEDGMQADRMEGLIMLKNDEHLKHLFGKAIRPYLGPYRQKKCALFFPTKDTQPSSVAILPLYRRGKYLGSFNLGSIDSERFSANMATDFLERLSFVLSVCLENTLNYELLRRTSLIDPLTGVNNRRFFDQRIGEEIDRAHRCGECVSCLFLDIDHFKNVNDTFGHQMGDQILADVAAEIKSQLRNNDVLARYGGEEFVALLSGANELKAVEVAERIRQCVENYKLESKDARIIKVTISAGVATFEPSKTNTKAHIDAAELVDLADQALYEAKRNGRNKVVSKGIVPFDKQLGAAKMS